MDLQERFQILRGLLSDAGSAALWTRLTSTLTSWSWPDPHEKEVIIDYVDEHLATWDDDLRKALVKEWWQSFPKEAPDPLWRLARRLDVPVQRLGFQGLRALLQSSGLKHCTKLFLRDNQLGPGAIRHLVETEALSHCRVLGLDENNIKAKGAHILANAERLQGLRGLSLDQTGVGNGGLQALAASPYLGSLEGLDLRFCHISGVGVDALCKSPLLSQLRALALYGNALVDRDIPRLVQGAPLLEDLDLGRNDLDNRSVRTIVEAPIASQLTSLHLGGCRNINEDGAAMLATAPLDALKRLYLWSTSIGDEGIQHLASAPSLADIEKLCISDCEMTSLGLRHLLDATQMAKLKIFSIYNNAFDDQVMEQLAACPRMATVETLDLFRCGIGAEGAEYLAESPYLGHMNFLSIGSNVLTQRGLLALVHSQAFPALVQLSLRFIRDVDDAVIEALVSSPLASQLQILDLRGVWLSEHSLSLLAEASGLRQLQSLDISRNELSEAACRKLCEAPWLPGLHTLQIPMETHDAFAQLQDACRAHAVTMLDA